MVAVLAAWPCALQATFKGWMDIMYGAVDSREVCGSISDGYLYTEYNNLTLGQQL